VKNDLTIRLALISGLVVSALAAPVYAEVPTPADFAACNMKAADAVGDTASALPGPKAPDRRPDARGGVPDTGPRSDVQTPGSPGHNAPAAGVTAAPSRKAPESGATKDPSGTGTKDPQLEGIAADRVNDREYVAAYRSCMRQGGF